MGDSLEAKFRRVTGATMPSHIGSSVIIVGKVLSLSADGKSCTVESSDKKMIQVNRPLQVSEVVEVHGTARATYVDYVDHAVLSSTFDMDSYNEAVAIANSPAYSKLFGM